MGISILGINIKRIRTEKEISAYKLSKLANVGGATISEIESGIRQTLNSATAEKIANALGVTTNELFATETDIGYIVNDIEQTLRMILSSDELTLDDEEMTTEEKEKFLNGTKTLLDAIRFERK